MTLVKFKEQKLPDTPGVYMFLAADEKILYIGKATSLRDRVRSYFNDDVIKTRGKHIVDMVTLSERIKWIETDSVLEAVILEAALIKEHLPLYNTKEKDNKSFNYVVMTNERFPRVLVLRERTMLTGDGPEGGRYKYVFGPFPHGTDLTEAMKIIRRIFPYRDNCEPEVWKPCFNRQIGLCPGVCSGEISEKEYNEQIYNIKLFFEGKKSVVLRRLRKMMDEHAKKLEFETANEYKKMIFGLEHIKDISLIKQDVRDASQRMSRKRAKAYRIEAYDVAHISGKYTVGVMVVVEDGHPKKSDYRKFRIRIENERSHDTLHLSEVLTRRFTHPEWPKPDLIVIDGGTAQRRLAERTLKSQGIDVPVVSVVKDARHKPKAIMGDKELAESYKRGILVANAESHRFAVYYHRQLRERLKK